MRAPLDAYMTPPHYIAALLGEVNVYGTVYEPCVGDGAISGALATRGAVRKMVTNDINEDCEADTHFDAALEHPHLKFDWIVTNPPFSQELDILQTNLPHTRNLAFLARLSFLEPVEEREYFLEQTPPHQIIVLPRYSFRCNDAGKRATDSVTCCWLVWFEDKSPRRVSVWSRGRSQVHAALMEISDDTVRGDRVSRERSDHSAPGRTARRRTAR